MTASKSLWRLAKAFAALAILGLAGCSTPASRISKNQDFYDTLPAAQQVKIAEGQIAPGYDTQMVYIALGAPNRKYRRTTADGQRTVWSYIRIERRSDRDWVSVPVRVRGNDGKTYRTRERVRVDVEHEREIERMRVEFVDGRVSAFEELTR